MDKKRIRKIPSFEFEEYYSRKGFEYIIGADEVGRGAFAGPVVVGSVVFPKNIHIDGINDSKLLSPQKREFLFEIIIQKALYYSIDEISVLIINKVGIWKATQIAFRKSVSNILHNLNSKNRDKNNSQIYSSSESVFAGESRSLETNSSRPASLRVQGGQSSNNKVLLKSYNHSYFLLVDGFHIRYVKGIGIKNQKAIIKGDQKSVSISAASILAKVYRDNVMKKLHARFPEYRFDIHKGYGTNLHQEMIKKHGLCRLHRTSFNLSKFI